MKPPSPKTVRLGSFAIAVMLLCGCNDQRLAGSFKMTWMNSCEVRIARPEHGDSRDYVETTLKDGTTQFLGTTMLNGSVRTIAVKAPYITGYATTECAPEPEAKEGYFLIDSRSEEILYGMDEKHWNEALTRIGWQHPTLSKPRCVIGCW